MINWPQFNNDGDLPVGTYRATLDEVIEHFGTDTHQRQIMALRLSRIYQLVTSTKHLARFIIFGSFVTSRPEPNDVDIFLLMNDTFDAGQLTGEAAIVFDHLAAHNFEGASIFWIRQQAVIGGEQEAVEYWQIKRDGTKRGIVEVISND
jgi:hypothetical protein